MNSIFNYIKFISLAFAFLGMSYSAISNNLVIDSVQVSNDTIFFNISWENSWRTINPITHQACNYDAVWVFVKQKDCASGEWTHLDLDSSVLSHSTNNSNVEVYVDKNKDFKGVFVQRDSISDGTGDIVNVKIALKMKTPVINTTVKVFGIEMVRINDGAYYLGDGSATSRFCDGGDVNSPFLINTNLIIPVGLVAGQLSASSVATRPVGNIPRAYPKGFFAFYCMKYEITQGQYADFLNNINPDQANVRYYIGAINNYTISGSWPNIAASSPHRAVNFLSWADFCAYLDWACLRPMSELEYEKICRGDSIMPTANEYAWGTNIITDANTVEAGTLGNDNENVTNFIALGGGIANYNNNGIIGPLRAGFPAKTATSRIERGETYYGVSEMSGNVIEYCVNTDLTGITYNGALGDGSLTYLPSTGYGFANQGWPSETIDVGAGNGVSGKGGSTAQGAQYLEIANRIYFSFDRTRLLYKGGRGVR
ncbi:MAG: hypothetical protein A2X12_05555 [Bacteroidetes bacterium GWE2_29_8]|nr:MAG: hypothetical protein A2X12_05555 [Bacteroidetes bacterium GWE2_29_8]